jgi:Condensation domain
LTPKQQNISDIYPLSPLKRGILFELLMGREQGAYFEQFLCPFDGDVSLPDFEAAWQDLVDRHAVLRTAFITKGWTEPMQVLLAKSRGM